MKFKFEISAFSLHLIAMFTMLLDHMWATVISGNVWMNYVGRITFPIFAFLAVEGFYHTKDFKKYIVRLLVFALISEIPFNLMMGGSIFNIYHQNVMWTILIGLLSIKLIDNILKSSKKPWLKWLLVAVISLLVFILGTILMVDYGGAGVLTIIMFYLARGRRWYNYLLQALGLYFINFILIQNMDLRLVILGHELFFPTQGFAIFSLIPIWLYQGKQGPHNKYIKYFNYLFYPVHILILSLIALR